ncbi:MAG: small multi-drug export protein [Clostridia bacterium]|nr:small multi-drug export protein [Clostridia bacterium]
MTWLKNLLIQTIGLRGGVFFCAMIPFIELRGSIILGASLGIPWWQNFIISVLGNMLPVPFILLFLRWFLEIMKKTRLFGKFARWLERKAEKNQDKVDKYGFWGLTLLVAIPLPGTGAWTGSLVASLMRINFWKSLLACFIGVLIAGVVITLAAYGAVGFLSFLA